EVLDLGEGLLTDALDPHDVVALLGRVLLAIVGDALGDRRADPGQQLELGGGRRVDVDLPLEAAGGLLPDLIAGAGLAGQRDAAGAEQGRDGEGEGAGEVADGVGHDGSPWSVASLRRIPGEHGDCQKLEFNDLDALPKLARKKLASGRDDGQPAGHERWPAARTTRPESAQDLPAD